MSSISSLAPSSNSAPSTAGSASQPPISFNGLVSGLDTSSIIQGLLAIDQQQITDTKNEESKVQAEQTAYKQVEANLLTFQGDVSKLNAPTNNVFQARTATSSNTAVVNAAASSNAATGVYNMTVNSLAQAQEIASQGFASATSAITEGTLQLQLGNGTSTTITVDSSNNTLNGLAGTINDANAGVTATVVNDGTGSQPYRLLLTANNTGTANAVTITNNLAADAGGAVQPVFGSTYIGPASALSGASAGSSVASANSGAGGYTGTNNDLYTFTVTSGGTVGTDNNIELSYTNQSGSQKGTITVNPANVNSPIAVALGLQVQFSAGTLTAGQTFSVKTYVPTVQAAQNASVTLGTGAGALTVSSSTNQINNLIAGVTLQLQGTGTGGNNQATVTVAPDTTGIQQTIDSFASDFNSLMSFIDQQTAYDPESNTGGPLLGDTRVTEIQNQIRNMVQSVVAGVNPQMNNLSDLGITVNTSGQLQVNDTTLGDVLNGSNAAVSLSDISKLFGMAASSNSLGVQFIAGTDQTKASSTPYTVNITQAATQAAVTAGGTIGSQITIDNNSNTFNFLLDGQSATVTLASGTYTQAALAEMLQSTINSDSALAGRQISVGVQNNQLTFTSVSFGATSQVSIDSGNANSVLGLSGTEFSQGQDVQGNFIVNGVSEPATGIGQFLSGAEANANTSGLEVQVSLTPSQVGAGTQANLTVTRGLASQLDGLMNQLTDPETGRFVQIDNSFTTELTDLQKEQTQQTNVMNAKQQELLTEFTNMESTLAQLQAASSAINGLTSSTSSALTTPNTSAANSSNSNNSSSSNSSSGSSG